MVASQAEGSGGKPPEADDRRVAVINAKKHAITAFEPKSGPAWAALVELLLLDTQDVRPHLKELAFRALGGVLLVLITSSAAKRVHARVTCTNCIQIMYDRYLWQDPFVVHDELLQAKS